MDKFMYAVCIKEIEMCKSIAELELLVRKYAQATKTSSNMLYKRLEYKQMEEVILYYKLLCFSLNTFGKKSKRTLPDMLYVARTNAQERILSEILRFPLETTTVSCFTKLTTYEEFIDYFEFDSKLSLPSFNKFHEVLNSIIGDKPIHFDIEFNVSLSFFDFHSTNLPKDIKTLVYAIRYKQVNFPTQSQTVWDLFISKLVATTKHVFEVKPDVQKEILKLEQQISALQSLKSYYDQQ